MKKKLSLAAILILYAGLLSAPAEPPPNAPTVEDPLAWVPLFPKDVARVKSGKINSPTVTAFLYDCLIKCGVPRIPPNSQFLNFLL